MTGFKRVGATVFTGAVLMLGVAVPSAAFANDYTNPPPSTPKATVLAQQFDPPAPAPRTDTLPFTGADVAQMTVVGLGAVAAGAFAVRRGRRAASRTV
jgi:hypothetical protein